MITSNDMFQIVLSSGECQELYAELVTALRGHGYNDFPILLKLKEELRQREED